MKILQIIYESFGSPFGFGGAGVRAYEIYKRLNNKHDITLLCMRYPGARDGEIKGLKHIFVGADSHNLSKSVLSYTVKTANFIRRHGKEFDIIVENFLPSMPFFSRFLTKTPVLLQVQGIMEKHSFKKINLFYSVPIYFSERFYPSLYDKFIFVSDITRDKVMKRISGNIKLCQVIPNGIGRELLELTPSDGDYILFFSRIDIYTKGLDILLAAFTLISPEFPDLRLILAGYEFDSCAKLVSGLPADVREKVEYAGFLTGAEKNRLLSGAKMVILPSRHESSPISILEAAACGKPLITSNIAELSFVEKNNIGISFLSGSVKELKEQIALLLKDAQLRNRLGMHGREYSGKFLWDNIAVEFEKTLKSMALKDNQNG